MGYQHSDYYTQQARQAGYRSRAAYKLLEMHKQEGLIGKKTNVIDLGAAPGGWAQVCSQLVGKQGNIFAIDQQAILPILGVQTYQMDITCQLKVSAFINRLHVPIDLVLSDMAPKTTGIACTDQALSIVLATYALEFALQVLQNHGKFVVKVFQSQEVKAYVERVKREFQQVAIRKPLASRNRSAEIYIVAKQRRGG